MVNDNSFKSPQTKYLWKMTYPKNAQIGIPIKLVDKTSTPKT